MSLLNFHDSQAYKNMEVTYNLMSFYKIPKSEHKTEDGR